MNSVVSLKLFHTNVDSQKSLFATPIINKIVVNYQPGWTNGSFNLTNEPMGQLFSINITLGKNINLRIMMDFTVFKTDSGKKMRILQIPKFNYCDFRRSGDNVPLLSDLFRFVENYGNLLFKCPVEPGFFYIRDLPMGLLPKWSLFPRGKFQIILSLKDENNVKKPVNFIKATGFVTQN
jgi:Protein of unknown function (DUF1091)